MLKRNLLICSQPKNEIESNLKRIYFKRVQEMFQRAIDSESIFNIFDEIFHGLLTINQKDEYLYNFYESFLTITSYYQHSQAGRGSLIANLIKDFGNSEKMEFEFNLKNLPLFLDIEGNLQKDELTNIKFDIVNKINENIIFCELKMKVYSGCTAGRIEMMEKFNKFLKLIIEDEILRDLFHKGGINNIYLISGILFDISGDEANIEKDKEWGICYNGLLRGKDEILKTIKNNGIVFEEKTSNDNKIAFHIIFNIDDINVNIKASYGNEVIKDLFLGQQKYNIEHFRSELEEILYDDLWLGQILSISERTILNLNFKRNKRPNNFITSILKDRDILNILEDQKIFSDSNSFEKLINDAITNIEKSDKNLLDIKVIPAIKFFSLSNSEYKLKDYISDLVQFLSCEDLRKSLIERIKE